MLLSIFLGQQTAQITKNLNFKKEWNQMKTGQLFMAGF